MSGCFTTINTTFDHLFSSKVIAIVFLHCKDTFSHLQLASGLGSDVLEPCKYSILHYNFYFGKLTCGVVMGSW